MTDWQLISRESGRSEPKVILTLKATGTKTNSYEAALGAAIVAFRTGALTGFVKHEHQVDVRPDPEDA